MPEELRLPLLAAAVLIWYLVCAVRQSRSEQATSPVVVWREATDRGWSDWTEMDDVSASVSYDAMLATARERATAAATAVQFAVVAHPDDAPDYTLRVLFMSAVCERSSGDTPRVAPLLPSGRELAATGCGE